MELHLVDMLAIVSCEMLSLLQLTLALCLSWWSKPRQGGDEKLSEVDRQLALCFYLLESRCALW